MRIATLQTVIAQMRQFRDGDRPGFSLLLGAGASKSSGVPLGDELADLAFREFLQSSGNTVDLRVPVEVTQDQIRSWETNQPWYDSEKSRYQLAMENALVTPGVRATFLKRFTGKARPSRGYRRLAQLLKSRVFDTLYTTNFDELVQRGCEGVLDETLVHVNSLDQYPRQLPSPSDPRLLRLHGDYWHGNVLNTEGELEQTPIIRFDTVCRLSCPQGMIVIGYGGRDKKLMVDLFQRNIGNSHFLENGLFWCVRHRSEAPAHLEVLGDKDVRGRVHLVEIEGFDEVMELFARGFGLDTDKWVLTESLRLSFEAKALLADAAQLLICSIEDTERFSKAVSEAFARLANQLGANECAIITLQPAGVKVIAAKGLSSMAVSDLPTVALRSSPSFTGSFEVPSAELREWASLAGIADARRVVAFPVSRNSKRLGLALFCFDRSASSPDREERVISSVCGLLLLAIRRIQDSYSSPLAEHEEVARIAYSRWEQRGRPDGSADEDWSWAKLQFRKSIYAEGDS